MKWWAEGAQVLATSYGHLLVFLDRGYYENETSVSEGTELSRNKRRSNNRAGWYLLFNHQIPIFFRVVDTE